ncbi:PLP-dependent aminotransferase family protein [Planctomonas sp. JC2975]|uniref:MocR-like pyridoxine biosynthesis transcription factor PdxR n=1 Tax=Planctomonas sp. JC2975 TaxID=2729626 RepID=UPI00147403DC|nr:PLP-dependent aminotransferase family protein [Planctomonas sp. JC2975]NNC11812.1 PLP-dependent aminotransferase family protein [Planctomonas sp. JC2975]
MGASDFLQLDSGQAPAGERTAWLASQLRAAVADGRLPHGARLPATRVLAAELGLARGTVAEAYRRLLEEGLLATNRGGGTIVTGSRGPRAAASVETPDAASGSTLHNSAAGSAARSPEPILDLSTGLPDLSAFPRAAWLRAEREVLDTAGARELGYSRPEGPLVLREALSEWLARSRGVVCTPDDVIVTGGVTGAIALLAQTLRTHDLTRWAMEDPGSTGTRRLLDYWVDETVPVDVDDDGIDVGALRSTGARVVVVTPAHEYPTGVVLAPERRLALVDWAEEVDGIVIEDDYDAEHRYDRMPVRALQSLAPHRIAYVSSLSKTLAPALRLGWLVPPKRLHDELAERRWASDLGSPVVAQLVLARLLKSGILERQLRTLRTRHRQRRDAAVAAVSRYLPQAEVQGVAAGLHVLVLLPDHVDDVKLAEDARENGIRVAPLSPMRSRAGRPGIVIAYGHHSPAILERAVRTIGRLVEATAPTG